MTIAGGGGGGGGRSLDAVVAINVKVDSVESQAEFVLSMS